MATLKKVRGNGLKCFSIHSADDSARSTFAALAQERPSIRAFSAAAVSTEAADPETAAKRYLRQALESNEAPDFKAPVTPTAESRFKVIGTETVPLTKTRTVKFRQMLHDIPVYGSLVTVELDENNELVSLNSSLGEPSDVKPVAKISAQEAAASVMANTPYKKVLKDIVPRLQFYFEAARSKWRLAFIFEDVPVTVDRKSNAKTTPTAHFFDYVVDAQTGRVIAELPRTPTMATQVETAMDALNTERQFRIEVNDGLSILQDQMYNITTYDFAFGDPSENDSDLPGSLISPDWPPAAVSAHANAIVVAGFLRTVVKRNNIDDRGGAMDSSVNCVVRADSTGLQWVNAYWNGRQMVYGQMLRDGQLLTLAAALDIVGHEMFHGVTDSTSRLEYSGQSGALNESYSDIFGILIANWIEPDTKNWKWTIGDGFGRGGAPFRNFADPTKRDQPDNMRDFRVSPNTYDGDWGGVHINSGIHNKACYLMLSAEDASGMVFIPAEVAAIFYLALTQQLSRTSQFAASRSGALSAARSLYRNEPQDARDRKIAAVKAAFDEVGIE
ncbi:M4 family metallopeptidase [Pseudomonas synxantha]|uniref:Zn-dependent metalloprotease n=1 Tax=Pseudomonas synxantha TaxID=47883 RepID=A0ACC6JRZ2_9PSED|nr:M4 family metallopeptidase [Pseudomonas synxantha]MDR6609075.1 Zn-dependent metalloprotease [Pseudomonas synxantha]